MFCSHINTPLFEFLVFIIELFHRQFLRTLTHVDEGIKKMEKLIRDYYNDDGRTTFLMTSDHGMTDWGMYLLVLCTSK